jgi:hypothetical protein
MEARDGLPVSFLFKWCHSGESQRDRSVGGDNNKQRDASPRCLFHGARFHLRVRRRSAATPPRRPSPAALSCLASPAGPHEGSGEPASPRAAVGASPSAVPVRE